MIIPLDTVVEVMCSGVEVRRRGTCVIITSKLRRRVLKIIPEQHIGKFYAESSMLRMIEEKRDFLPCILPYYGSLWMSSDELIAMVVARDPQAGAAFVKALEWFRPPDADLYIGIMMSEYLVNCSDLAKYVNDNRTTSNYEAKLEFVLASLLSTFAMLQQLFPGMRHNDTLPHNILISIVEGVYDRARVNDPDFWSIHTLPLGPDGWVTARRPPGLRIAIIDFGMSTYPGCLCDHIAEPVFSLYGICDTPNPSFDTHLCLNSLFDLVQYSMRNPTGKLFPVEARIVTAMERLYGPELLGFGIPVERSIEAISAFSNPLTPSVAEYHLTNLGNVLKIFPRENAISVRQAGVIAWKRRQWPELFLDGLNVPGNHTTLLPPSVMNYRPTQDADPLTILKYNKLELLSVTHYTTLGQALSSERDPNDYSHELRPVVNTAADTIRTPRRCNFWPRTSPAIM